MKTKKLQIEDYKNEITYDGKIHKASEKAIVLMKKLLIRKPTEKIAVMAFGEY